MNTIQYAEQYLNHKEVTRNSSPLIDKWLKTVHCPPRNPWCAAFVCSMFALSGHGLPILTASSQALKRWGQKNHLLTTEPQQLLNWKSAIFVWTNRDKIHGHTGLVAARYTSDGKVVAIGTIEGNTNGGGSRSGDGVYRLRRELPHSPSLFYINTSLFDQWW